MDNESENNNEFRLLNSENREIVHNSSILKESLNNTLSILENNEMNNNSNNIEVHNSFYMNKLISQNSKSQDSVNNSIKPEKSINDLKQENSKILKNVIPKIELISQNPDINKKNKKSFIYNINGNLYAGINNEINHLNDNNIIISDLQKNSFNNINYNSNINFQNNNNNYNNYF